MGTPLGDIATVVSLAESALRFYHICFDQLQEPGDQLLEFGATLQGFGGNLEVLNSICESVASRLSNRLSRLPGFQQLEFIIRASRPILKNCQEFLQKHASTIEKRGPGTNLVFYLKNAQNDLGDLHRRILAMNGQLITAIGTVNLHITILYGGLIEERKWPKGDPLRPDSAIEPRPIQVPSELGRSLRNTARQQYRELDSATMMGCINTSITHLSKAKDRLEYASKNPVRQDWEPDVVLDLMISAWILTAMVKPRCKSPATILDIQATAPDTELRVESLVWRVEEELRSIFDSNSLGSFESDKEKIKLLLSSFDSHPFIQWKVRRTTPRSPPTRQLEETELHFDRILSINLKSEGSTQELRLYQQDEKTLLMVRVNDNRDQGTRESSKTSILLKNAQFVPLYAFPKTKSGVWNASIQTIPNSLSESLRFADFRTLLQFQQAMTGYETKHSDPNISVKRFEGRFFGGESKKEYGKLQIWAHNPLKKENEDSKSSGYLPSIISDPASSTTSSNGKRSIQNAPEASLRPNLNMLQHRAAQTTRKSIFDKRNKMGILLEEPEPPYLILFIEDESTPQGDLSFISIEMNLSTTIDICDCHKSNNECIGVVLEAPGGLKARSCESSNLAAVGIYQRANIPEVAKKLRHVKIQFHNEQRRAKFIEYFRDVQGLYQLKLVDFQKGISGR